MAEPFFRVERLTRRFGGLLAVNDVSFELQRDQIVGLIGPNGAGKTTLLRLITRVLRADSGKVICNVEDISSLRVWDVVNHGIACTFQNTRPFRHLPIVANVMVPLLAPRAHARGDWVRKIDAKAMDALEFVGIADQALEPASALSQGDLKRLEVARAIATEPELLLLDEPLGGLNPAESELLARSIKRLHKGGRFGRLHSEGPAVVMIEHKLKELMSIADRVIVMDHGEVLAAGERIEGLPAHEIRKRGLVHCPERRRPFRELTVEENLLAGAYLSQSPAGTRRSLDRAYALFPRLAERKRQLAGKLSGGEQQMLATARALMFEAKLLAIDEPSLGLAPRVREELFSAIGRIHAEGIPVLLVEQEVAQVFKMADRNYVLSQGRIIAAGTAAHLTADESLRAGYLGL